MLLDVGSTNGMPRGEHAVPSSFCHVPSLDQAGLRQARLVSHNICWRDPTKRRKHVTVTILWPRHSN
jgi:hypothetical protein